MRPGKAVKEWKGEAGQGQAWSSKAVADGPGIHKNVWVFVNSDSRQGERLQALN